MGKTLIIAALLLAAACGGREAPASTASAAEAAPVFRARLDPDFAGPIDEWIVGLSTFHPGEVIDTLADLMRVTDPRIRFRVLYRSDAAWQRLLDTLGPDAEAVLPRIRRHRTEHPVQTWTRDLFLTGMGADGSPAYFLPAPGEYRIWVEDDDDVTHDLYEDMRQFAGDRAVPTGLLIDGGMVVSDSVRAYLAPHPLFAALDRKEVASEAEFRHEASAVLGRNVKILHPVGKLPSSHCDIYVALATNGHAVVADAVLGADLAADVPPEERARFDARVLKARQGGRFPADVKPGLLGRLVEDSETPGVVDNLNHLARFFREEGYEVVRVPHLGQSPQRTDGWLNLSYTNVIQEVRDGRPVVYMPVYGLTALDEAAKQAWEGMGYRVVTVDCLGSAVYAGSLRCLSQVTRLVLPALPPPRRVR